MEFYQLIHPYLSIVYYEDLNSWSSITASETKNIVTSYVSWSTTSLPSNFNLNPISSIIKKKSSSVYIIVWVSS